MSIRAVADTHALIWYIYDDPRLSETARSTMEAIELSGNHIAAPSISLVEMVYLIEKARIPAESLGKTIALFKRANPFLVEVALGHPIVETMRLVDRQQVPDMPDRIITATALHLGVPVISRDGKIRLSTVATIW